MKLRMCTEYPIASDSMDVIDGQNSGSQNDNSRNSKFNQKLYKLFDDRKPSTLDVGCAGGGFVHECIKDGCFAAGIDGNDFCRRTGKFEWPNIPDNLFTCDLTKKFTLYDETNGTMKFDVITAWELMEHLREVDLPQFFDNINFHLKDGGLFICSVSEQFDNWHFHKNLHNRDWWLNTFSKYGFKNDEGLWAAFEPDWIRSKYRTEHAFDAGQSFNLVLQKEKR